jgi:hypothetical protein
MTWTNAIWKAAIWVLPNALTALGLIVLFYIVGIADTEDLGALEAVVWIVLVVSLGCLVAIPMTAGVLHRSVKVLLLAALLEVAAIGVLAALYFDFFGGWIPRGFHS